MEDYNKIQREKAEAKLAGALLKFVTKILMDWNKDSHDPEFKKTVIGLSSYGGEFLWKRHGTEIKKHLISISNSLIHPIHGTLHEDHETHTSTAAEKAANEIWASYENH